MASAVDESKKNKSARKRKHSQELLKLPEVSGLNFIQRECTIEGSKPEPPKAFKEPPKTFRVETSSVLSRVQSFLPVMREADKELQKILQTEQANHLDVEAVTDGEPCIEMDLAVLPLVQDQLSDDSSTEDSESSEDDSDVAESGLLERCHELEKPRQITKIRTSKRTKAKVASIEEVG